MVSRVDRLSAAFEERSRQPESPRLPFHDAVNQLIEMFGAHGIEWFMTNGGAMHFYAQAFGIDRYPTDIDLTVHNAPLEKVLEILLRYDIPATITTGLVRKWGLYYCEPQIKAMLGGLEVDILIQSRILRPMETAQLQTDFTNTEFQEHVIRINRPSIPPLAPLEYLRLAKEFQNRPHPKQDKRDLELIQQIVTTAPELYNHEYFKYLEDRWISH